jgi:hypothetical protein
MKAIIRQGNIKPKPMISMAVIRPVVVEQPSKEACFIFLQGFPF